jgi:hypothetical protein
MKKLLIVVVALGLTQSLCNADTLQMNTAYDLDPQTPDVLTYLKKLKYPNNSNVVLNLTHDTLSVTAGSTMVPSLKSYQFIVVPKSKKICVEGGGWCDDSGKSFRFVKRNYAEPTESEKKKGKKYGRYTATWIEAH